MLRVFISPSFSQSVGCIEVVEEVVEEVGSGRGQRISGVLDAFRSDSRY